MSRAMLSVMRSTPYNFCDYRCERCLETAVCGVFKRLQKDSLLDTDDPAALLNALQTSFRETETMIKQKAREFGIDIDQLAGGASAEDIREQRRGTTRDALYEETHQFALETRGFLDAAELVIADGDREFLDDIAWHHTIVSAKVYRALGWKTEGEIADDARSSAAVAMKSLTICIMAFDQLASSPKLFETGKRLSAAGAHLKGSIKNRFALGRLPDQ
jgi:hypothetical protein